MRGLVAATMMAAGLGACLAPAGSLPTEVRASVERQLGQAGVSYARAVASPDFISRAALSSAAAADWVLDYNEARGPYCGTGGCPLQVWVKDPGGLYRLAFDQQVLGWRAGTKEGGATLHVSLHGALCGRSAIEDCAQDFRWVGGAAGAGRFVPVMDERGERAGPIVQPIRLDPDEAPTPVRYAVKAYEAACMRAGGVPEMGQSVQRLPDLNDDGAPEMLFDASIAWCWTQDRVAAVRPDCKAGACDSRLFSPSGDGWREILAAPKLRYRIGHQGAGPVMKVDGRTLRRPS
jgi:hypothetical protein